MKNSVNGSRQTTMNSLNRIAPRPRKRRDFIAKLQISSSKSQRNSNSQIQTCSRAVWYLALGICLGLETWDLGFLCSCCFLILRFARGFARECDENVFERWPHLMDLGLFDTDAAQLFVDLRFLDFLIDQEV